jgi:hypothetical protein
MATVFVHKKVMDGLAAYERKELSAKDMDTIMFWAKKWNLVWINLGELGPLTPEEIEICLGFDPGHSRVIFSTCDKVWVLGNSFQVNTVAVHLFVFFGPCTALVLEFCHCFLE